MSTPSATQRRPQPTAGPTNVDPRQIAFVRAGLALVWAAVVVIAVGGNVPSTDSGVPFVAAAALATYPLIDVIASLLSASRAGAAGLLIRINAAIGVVAVIAIGVAAFGSDAGATLIAFGAWATVSGALQLGTALHRPRQGRELPMIVSGALSTVAGLSFIAAASKSDANLAALGGYMAVGAVLFVVWAFRAGAAR